MCQEWRDSFSAFYRDMGLRPTSKHSIDRIDNDGPYCKENCRWATWTQQASNRRNNRHVEHEGQTRTVSAWSRLLGGNKMLVSQRLKQGWSPDKAVTTPRDMRRHPKARATN